MKKYIVGVCILAILLPISMNASEQDRQTEDDTFGTYTHKYQETYTHTYEPDSDDIDSQSDPDDELFEFSSPEDRLQNGLKDLPKKWQDEALAELTKVSSNGAGQALLAPFIAEKYQKLAESLLESKKSTNDQK